MQNLSHKILSIQLSAIKEMERQARGREDILSLAQGIPYFPTPGAIAQKVATAVLDGSASYYTIPEGLLSLREAISEDIKNKTGATYCPRGEVLVTAGAMAAIQALFLTLLNPGDEVLVITPAYASYFGQIISAGGIPRSVPLDKNFRLDPCRLRASITPRTKALLFANPANPSGTNFSRQELQTICDFACQEDLYLISDEVYRDFIWEGEHTSCAVFPEVRDRMFMVFGFSKAYSMTGYRVGYVCGPESVLDHTMKVHDNLVTCAPHPAQIGALGALEEPRAKIKHRLNLLKSNGKLALDLVADLPFLSAHAPQGAYYLFCPIGNGTINSLAFCQYLLEEARVATVPGIAFGPEGEGFLRICYAVEPSRITTAFERLKALYHRGIDFSSFQISSPFRQSA